MEWSWRNAAELPYRKHIKFTRCKSGESNNSRNYNWKDWKLLIRRQIMLIRLEQDFWNANKTRYRFHVAQTDTYGCYFKQTIPLLVFYYTCCPDHNFNIAIVNFYFAYITNALFCCVSVHVHVYTAVIRVCVHDFCLWWWLFCVSHLFTLSF